MTSAPESSLRKQLERHQSVGNTTLVVNVDRACGLSINMPSLAVLVACRLVLRSRVDRFDNNTRPLLRHHRQAPNLGGRQDVSE
jgi:hypothetical protein